MGFFKKLKKVAKIAVSPITIAIKPIVSAGKAITPNFIREIIAKRSDKPNHIINPVLYGQGHRSVDDVPIYKSWWHMWVSRRNRDHNIDGG